MKILTANAKAAASARTAVKSLVILKIDWPSGTVYYADRDYTFGANSCLGRILSLGPIDSQQKATNYAGLTSVTVTLDDSDSSIKSKVNTDLIEGTPVTVYYHFDSLAASDAVVMLTGKIQGSVEWSEGERHLSFTADSDTYANRELSFAPQLTDIAGMSSNAIGKTWPLAFGKPIKVPAIELFRLALTKITAVSGQSPGSVVTVDDGSDFPITSTQVDAITAEGGFLRCTGTMVGNRFTLSSVNDSVATNITFGTRLSDGDIYNSSVAWITTDINLVGCYCKITHSTGAIINFCYKQEGLKCYFWKAWLNKTSGSLLLPGSGVTRIDDAKGDVATSWGATFEQYSTVGSTVFSIASSIIPDSRTLLGDQVFRAVGSTTKYICALKLPQSTGMSLLAVYAHRTYRKQKILAQVPSSYFTYNLSDTVGGKPCITISMTQRLSMRNNENWEDDLFVTMNSGLSQNPAQIIDNIVTNYTSLTSDSASLASVAATLTAWPANFAILDTKNVIDAIQAIAYQARVGLTIVNNKVYYRYLSILSTIDYGFSENSVKYQSMSLSFTGTTDLITSYTCLWRKDYEKTDPEKYIYKNNVTGFGVRKDEYDYFIYNDLQLVKLTANFWGYRNSNAWRKIRYIVFLQALGIEVLDNVSNNFGDLPTALNGVVDEANFDTEEREISISQTLACKSGSLTADANFYTGDPAYPVTTSVTVIDKTIGLTLIDYKVPVDPIASTPDKRSPGTFKFIVSCSTAVIQRGVNFTITVQLYDDKNYLVPNNITANLSLSSTDSADVLSVTSVNLTSGVGTITAQVTGGSGIDTCTVGATYGTAESLTTGASPQEQLQDEGLINWITVPLGVQRGENFAVLLQGGAVSAVYNVSLTQSDTDVLKQGTTTLTTITTDASGNYSASDWHFENGLYAINSVKIVLTRAGNTFPSPQLIVVSKDPAVGIVYKAAVGSYILGDCVQPNGSGGWADGVTLASGHRSWGVVGYIDASSNMYVVVRGMVCIAGLTNHTDYNIGTAPKTLITGAGSYVLRHYQGGLCWVGGSSAIASIDDIGDVVITTVAANQVLVNDGTNWVNKTLAAIDGLVWTYPSNVPTIGITDHAVALSKLVTINPYSVICNAGATSLSPDYVSANAEYKVFMRRDAVLDFRFISKDSIEDKAVVYSKIQDVVATSVIGRASGSTGVVAPITASADGQVLQQVSGSLVFASIATAILPTSGVTAGTYGSNGFVAPIITINAQGLITAASNTVWTAATNTGTSANTLGFVSGVLTLFVGNKVFNANKLMDTGIVATTPTTDQELAFDGTNWTPTAPTGAGAGTYGSNSYVAPIITVNANGRITAISNSVSTAATNTGTSGNTLGFVSGVLTIFVGNKVFNANKLMDTPVSATAPTTGQVLQFDGTNAVWASVSLPANPADTGYVLIPGSGAAAPVWSRSTELGTGSLTGTSTVGSLIVDVSTDGDCFKLTTVGLELYDRSQSTTVPVFKVSTSGTNTRLDVYDIATNSGAPSIQLRVDDLTAAYKTYFNGTLSGNIRLREVDVVSSGAAKKMMLLCSLPY